MLVVDSPLFICLSQEMVLTTTTEASAIVAHVDHCSCPLWVEAHGGNGKD